MRHNDSAMPVQSLSCIVAMTSYVSCGTTLAEVLHVCSEPGRQAARHARG